MPRLVAIDPMLMLALHRPTAASGMDALTHAGVLHRPQRHTVR